MESVFIALLHNVEISEDLGKGDKINDSMRITNNRAVIESLLNQPHRQLIGDMEFAYFLTGQPVIYSKQETPKDPQEHLLERLYEVQSFLLTTWIFMDNAINCELGFLLYTKYDHQSFASSNFLPHQYSDCRSCKQKTKITRDKLREMREFYRSAIHFDEQPFQRPKSQLTSNHPRFTRAFYMIDAARGCSDLAIRVAHYCTVFEILFATSQTELAHQLSERVACFLHSDPDKRLLTYRKMKHAYGFRSKVVHGTPVKESELEKIAETSEFCDSTLRAIIFRMLTEETTRSIFKKDSQSFDEYMLKTIFSVGT